MLKKRNEQWWVSLSWIVLTHNDDVVCRIEIPEHSSGSEFSFEQWTIKDSMRMKTE
jgi:hypothetical protein